MTLHELLGFNPNYQYSTMRPGGLDQRVMYNGVECIWGLNEMGHPPTLIYPRPKIELITFMEDEYFCFDERFDIAMERCIQRESPEKIVEAMFDKSIKFEYDDR